MRVNTISGLVGLMCLLSEAQSGAAQLQMSAEVAKQGGSAFARLAEARSRWTAAALTAYEYTVSIYGLFPPPFPNDVRCRVTPVAAAIDVISWRNPPRAEGEQMRPATGELFVNHCGVEKLFAIIDAGLRRQFGQVMPPDGDAQWRLWRPPVIEYDARGWPIRVAIDPGLAVTDDEIYFNLKDFIATPGAAVPAPR